MRKLLLALAIVASIFASCKKSPETSGSQYTVSLSADEAFGSNGSATLTLKLSEPMPTKCTVTLGVGAVPQDGKVAIATGDISISPNPVIILMNKEHVSATVNIDKTKMKKNSQAVITIEAADGIKVKQGEDTVYINWTGGDAPDSNDYGSDDPESPDNSEDPSGSDDPSGSEDPAGMTPTRGWSIKYDGYDEEEESEILVSSGNGTEGVYVYVEDEGYIASFGGDLNAFLEDASLAFADELDFLSAYDWTAEDLIITEDPGYTYYDQFDAGTYEAIMVGMDTDGNTTGKWAYCTFTIEEEEIEIGGPITKVASWQTYYVGRYETLYDGENTQFDRFAMDWTEEDTYFLFELYDPGMIEENGVEESLKDLYRSLWSDYSDYAGFYDIDAFLLDSEYNYLDYFATDDTEYETLIAEFTAEGELTGRYNISSVTITGETFDPGDSADYAPAKSRRLAPRKYVKTGRPMRKRL